LELPVGKEIAARHQATWLSPKITAALNYPRRCKSVGQWDNLTFVWFHTVIHARQSLFHPEGAFGAITAAFFDGEFARSSRTIETFSGILGITGTGRAITLHANLKIFCRIVNLCHLVRSFPHNTLHLAFG
jgi:hypothetical protein